MKYLINQYLDVSLRQYPDESFVIDRREDWSDSRLGAELLKHDKEPAIYHLRRVMSGKRRKEWVIPCYRFNSGEFLPLT